MLTESNYQEIMLQCADCSSEFAFTSEEQDFYQQKGFSQPKRCAACRAQNRQSKKASRPTFEAVCDQCGVSTTVPFQPVQSKPVYCSDCYQSMR